VKSHSAGVSWFPLLYTPWVTTTTRDTPKQRQSLNVSYHLLRVPPTHSQMRLLDPMHACLNVDEILRGISRELIGTPGGEGAVVALACCCKSFEDPVLDTLWIRQNELLPLLWTFPEDVWNDDGWIVSGPTTCMCFRLIKALIRKSFKRLPTATEWGRFRKYARRMRKLIEYHIPDIPSLEPLSAMQLCTINEPLVPNLQSLELFEVHGPFIPFIPLFLSPRTTSIFLMFSEYDCPKAMVASVVTTLPKLCPSLQTINLLSLPRDPMITTAISEMVLATNRDTLQTFRVDSPLTKEADEVVYKLSNLRDLSIVIEKVASLSSTSLPNLTGLTIKCKNEHEWPQLFHGATLGKLESVVFHPESGEIGDFLGAFERVALSSSIQHTLSMFCIYSSNSWNPNYSSLLPFTQLVNLVVKFYCGEGCSSRVDDNIIIGLSRAMPKLKVLELGYEPCRESTTGVTAKGLLALALHCPDLQRLCIHIQVSSLSVPPARPGIGRNTESTASWTDCALTNITAGDIPMPEESALMVALTLLRIFPRIVRTGGGNAGWRKVDDAIYFSKRIVDYSSK